MTFQELGLSEPLLRAAEALNFQEPTPVQAQSIPFMLNNEQDLVSLAQTGTGKTAAFGFPLLHDISLHPTERRTTQALVLAPTRELCIQIAKDLTAYAQFLLKMKIVPVYGGEDIRKQLYQLDVTPQILVATPGRLIDLIKRGKVSLQDIRYLVLDEADEMLNMGFQEAIEEVISHTPDTRRTMLFSATMPPDIARIARQYMHDAHEIQIGERNAGTENVDHIYYVCRAQERYLVLKRVVDLNPDLYAIVFCRTKAETQEIAEKLIKDGYNADSLHGDLTQAARDGVMQRFRLRGVRILVATDVAARGLDVHDLTHVINYQLPDDPEVYTHRSGRTGRANKRGICVNIVHQRETRRIANLERMLRREFRRERIPSGMEVCKKQLFHFISRVQNADLSLMDETTTLDGGLHEVAHMLDYLSKEEIIKRFVSLEFNRFLEYYQNAPDLNVPETKTERRGASERGKQERGMRGKTVRLKINVGMNDGMNPKRFLGLVNDTTRDRTIAIGNIEIAKNYTFFDVFLDQKQKIVSAFRAWDDLQVQEVKGRRAAGADTSSARPNRERDYDKPYGKSNDRGQGRERRGHDNAFDKGRNKDFDKDNGKGRNRSSHSSDKPWRNRR